MNAAFAPNKVEVSDIPLWRQTEVIDAARSFAWPVGTLLLAAMVLLGVIRPAMKTLLQPPALPATDLDGLGNQLDAIEGDQPDRPQLSGPGGANDTALTTAAEQRLEDARKLTRDNPAAVANIVKAWMSGEAPA